MQKESAGSENLIGVGGSIKDVAAKIWGQLVVGLLSNFTNRILRGWLSLLLLLVRGRTSNQSIQAFPRDHLSPQSSFSSTYDFYSAPASKTTHEQPHPATSMTWPVLLLGIAKRRTANTWRQLQEQHLSGGTKMQ